ncbi:MAG TPA: (Fe-S)-binding protein, partial [Anaerolineae bacterium]|nr:(Fe-S)-binding protein [Anaerolineae bacterium]
LTLPDFPLTVPSHDPGARGRNGHFYEPPRQSLAAVPGLRLIEAAENRERGICCGGGGDLEMVDPALTTQVGVKAVEKLAAPGVEAIVTACPQCVRMFKSATENAGRPIEVLDLVQVIDRALEREK